MRELASLKKMAEGRRAGPAAVFGLPHLFRAIQVIGSSRGVGRTLLAKRLGLGGGAIRTLVGRLRATGLVTVREDGCRLTPKGSKIFREISKKIPIMVEVDAGRLSLARHNCSLLVRDSAHLVRTGLEERDAAIRAGGSGTITLLHRNGRLIMPGGSQDCERDYPDPIWARLRRVLSPGENDMILIAGGESAMVAEYAAIAAAISVLGLW